MKNHKQLLADFYLELLAIPNPPTHILITRISVCTSLAIELGESPETVERIFEKMVTEDAKY